MSSHSLHSQCSNTFEEQLVYIKHCSGEPHPAFCKKIIQTIKLRPGLWISIMDFTPSAPLTLKYEKKQSTIDFGYLLSGTMRRQIQSRSTERMELQNRAGMAGITFIPESQGILEIQSNQNILILHVHITPELLHSLLKEELNILPSSFKPVLDGSGGKDYITLGKMNASVHKAVHRIMTGQWHGMPKQMFFEAKALELISLQIAWLNCMEGNPVKAPVFSPNERESIYMAKKLLVQDLEKPPLLSQLSRQVGLSINKLESGFKEIFGMSVFAFLKEYKMQQAKHLFQEADMNVSQVAWSVGYINVSHFSNAFKNRFNILPKHYLNIIKHNKK